MTTLSAGSSVTLSLKDGGQCSVATNGGAASVTITPTTGQTQARNLGPLPERVTFGPFSEGATVVITNQTAVLDYDMPGGNPVQVVTTPTGGSEFSDPGKSAVTAVVNSNTIAALGDSITKRNLPDPASNVWFYGSDGYLVQGNIQLGWPFEIVGVVGYPGMDSAYILANGIPAVLALSPRPSKCVVLVGPNDVVPTGISASSPAPTIANLKAIYAALLAAGIEPECCTLPPRNDAASGIASSVPTKRVLIQVNAWIRSFARANKFKCHDFYRRLVNPTITGTGGWALVSDSVGALSDTSSDQVHPSDYGGYLMGLEFAANHAGDAVKAAPKISGPRVIAGMAVSGQTAIVEGQIVPNPAMFGTAGTVGATATGTLANEWSVQLATLPAGAGTITLSKVKKSDSFSDWQQIAIEGGTLGANPGNLYIRSDQDYPSALGQLGAATWQVGDTVYAQCSFEKDATNWGGTDGLTPCMMYLRVQFLNATGAVLDTYCHSNAAPSSRHREPSGVMRTPPFAIPTGTTRLYAWVGFRGKGTVRVSDVDIVKVIA